MQKSNKKENDKRCFSLGNMLTKCRQQNVKMLKKQQNQKQ